ncbi:MAG: hypothetical protein Q7K55_02550 [Candidatus Levybacteria bacterium]|nr:hypothetical protein [Candidatus Levybacteria bacterium]
MQLLIVPLIIYSFINPNLGLTIFIVIVALLEAWIVICNLRKVKVKNENNKYTSKEVEVIEKYRLFFQYPFASKMLSPIFSAIQLSVYIMVPLAIFKGLYVHALLIGVNYFISTNLAVILNPQFFLHDNLDKGRIKDPSQLLKYRYDMDAIDSALKKMYLVNKG